MYCPKCGIENPDDRNLCVSCSWVLRSDAASTAANAQTCGLATAALILAALIFPTFLLSMLPAIIYSVLAIFKISKSQGSLTGMKQAVAALTISIIIIPGILAVIAAIMYSNGKLQHIVCESNMKGLSAAISTYTSNNDGKYPTGDRWCDLLTDQADVYQTSFICFNLDSVQFCYGLNENLQDLSTEDVPPDMVMLFDIEGGINTAGGPELLYTERHKDKGCFIAYTDGRVEWVDAETFEDLKWTVE